MGYFSNLRKSGINSDYFERKSSGYPAVEDYLIGDLRKRAVLFLSVFPLEFISVLLIVYDSINADRILIAYFLFCAAPLFFVLFIDNSLKPEAVSPSRFFKKSGIPELPPEDAAGDLHAVNDYHIRLGREILSNLPFSILDFSHLNTVALNTGEPIGKTLNRRVNKRFGNVGMTHNIQSPVASEKSNPTGGALLVQNLRNGRVIALKGVELRIMAFHIKPNYSDFLRKLSMLQLKVPFTVDIEIISASKERSAEFKYRILFYRYCKKSTIRSIKKLLSALNKAERQVLLSLKANFPHFKFAPILPEKNPSNILTVIADYYRGSSENERSSRNLAGHFYTYNFRRILFPLIIHLLFFFFVIPFTFLSRYGNGVRSVFDWDMLYRDPFHGLYELAEIYSIIFRTVPDGIYAVIISILIIVSLIIFIWFLFRCISFVPISEDSFPGVKSVGDGSGLLLYDKSGGLFYFYDMTANSFSSVAFFIFKSLNRYFQFNPVKFYRDLMSIVNTQGYSINFRISGMRIPVEDLHLFQNIRDVDIMDLLNGDLMRSMAKYRKISGLFKVFPMFIIKSPSFSVMEFKGAELLADGAVVLQKDDSLFYDKKNGTLPEIIKDNNIRNNLYKSLLDVLKDPEFSSKYFNSLIKSLIILSEETYSVFMPSLTAYFPECIIEPYSCKTLSISGIIPSRHLNSFKTNHSFFILKGSDLIPFIKIPEEIHRYIPAALPVEFSIPSLNDEIPFGSVINTEYMEEESELSAGINGSELLAPILFTTENYTVIRMWMEKLFLKLLGSGYAPILFDFNGDFFDNLNEHYPGSEKVGKSIPVYRVGSDFGIRLFDLPYNIRGPEYVHYIQDLKVILGQIYDFGEEDMALFSNIIFQVMDRVRPIGSTTIVNIVDDFFEERGAVFIFSNPLRSFLSLLQTDIPKKAFDNPYNDFYRIFDSIYYGNSPVIVSLKDLKNRRLKALFMRAFLLQLFYYRSYLERNGVSLNVPGADAFMRVFRSGGGEIAKIESDGGAIRNLFAEDHQYSPNTSDSAMIRPVIIPEFDKIVVYRTRLRFEGVANGFLEKGLFESHLSDGKRYNSGPIGELNNALTKRKDGRPYTDTDIIGGVGRRFALIAGASMVSFIPEDIRPMFRSIFAGKTVQDSNIKVLRQMLRLDNSFISTFSNSHRHMSYQSEYLRILGVDDAVVYRDMLDKPFLFKFAPYGVLIHELFDKRIRALNNAPEGDWQGYFNDDGVETDGFRFGAGLHNSACMENADGDGSGKISWHDPVDDADVGEEPSSTLSALEGRIAADFIEFPQYHSLIYNFLFFMDEIEEVLEIVPYFELQSYFGEFIQSHRSSTTGEYYNQTVIQKILQKLIERSYFVKETLSTASVDALQNIMPSGLPEYEYSGYRLNPEIRKLILHERAIKSLKEDRNLSRPEDPAINESLFSDSQSIHIGSGGKGIVHKEYPDSESWPETFTDPRKKDGGIGNGADNSAEIPHVSDGPLQAEDNDDYKIEVDALLLKLVRFLRDGKNLQYNEFFNREERAVIERILRRVGADRDYVYGEDPNVIENVGKAFLHLYLYYLFK